MLGDRLYPDGTAVDSNVLAVIYIPPHGLLLCLTLSTPHTSHRPLLPRVPLVSVPLGLGDGLCRHPNPNAGPFYQGYPLPLTGALTTQEYAWTTIAVAITPDAHPGETSWTVGH